MVELTEAGARRVVTGRFATVEQMNAQSGDWTFDFRQLDAGATDAEIEQLAEPGILVQRARFSRTYDQRGETPAGLLSFGFLDRACRAYVLGRRVGESELAVLGFEVGYSFDTPDGLVMWEAQFGDFANGAQMIVDQFMASCEQKWGRYCGTVMMLPHGYEGQGPEHSSARLERYLVMCAEDNMQIANCSTPASFFHLLRRQVIRKVRKPLVVMTPKSLLRHPLAVSTLDDLAEGSFQPVLPEVDDLPASGVRRLVLCSGKVYYELLRARREAEQTDVALVRLEQLYPFPAKQLASIYDAYPQAEVVWCQEEPKNMGAWPQLLHWFLEHLPMERLPRYVGRPAAATPATGSHHKHVQEQDALVTDALQF